MYSFQMRKMKRVAPIFLVACAIAMVPTTGFAVTFDSVSHIHDVKVFGKKILMPTHEGLYSYRAANSMERVRGPIFDVMGLGIYGTTLYASGHPGAKSNFAEPVGLISSNDGGEGWKQISLSGQVDFHMLEVGKFDMYGADSGSGQLMHSIDKGKNWRNLGQNKFLDISPLNTKRGAAYALLEGTLVKTSDSFATTNVIKTAMKFKSIEVVGKSVYASSGPDIYLSNDQGAKWKKIATFTSEISSISANSQLLVAVSGGSIFVSRDSGKKFKS